MVEKFLKEYLSDDRLNLVDVGAKGGTFELPRLAPFINCFGFEPNPSEFEVIQNLKKNRGSAQPNYFNQKYLNVALSNEVGKSYLNITNQPSLSSLLKVDWDTFDQHYRFMKRYHKWKTDLSHQREVMVETTTMDLLCPELGLARVDYLKLDTQGTELQILEGAQNLLGGSNIGVIKCEVAFIPVYKGQCLFSDIDQFLRDHGFVFVDCLFYPQLLYGRLSSKIKNEIPIKDHFDIPRYSAGGDAIYVLDLSKVKIEERKRKSLKYAVVLAELGYMGLAYQMLIKYSGLTNIEIVNILNVLAKKSINRRIKKFADDWIPQVLLAYLKHLYHKVF